MYKDVSSPPLHLPLSLMMLLRRFTIINYHHPQSRGRFSRRATGSCEPNVGTQAQECTLARWWHCAPVHTRSCDRILLAILFFKSVFFNSLFLSFSSFSFFGTFAVVTVFLFSLFSPPFWLHSYTSFCYVSLSFLFFFQSFSLFVISFFSFWFILPVSIFFLFLFGSWFTDRFFVISFFSCLTLFFTFQKSLLN